MAIAYGTRTDQTQLRLDHSIARLTAGRSHLQRASLDERIAALREVTALLYQHARTWVDLSCEAKSIPLGSNIRAEEILSGPVAVVRYLLLLAQTLTSIKETGRPTLPGRLRVGDDSRLTVPIVPTRGIYDRVIFRSMRAAALMQRGVSADDIHGDRVRRLTDTEQTVKCVLVLGAGNVSSVAVTDMLSKLFQERQVVLLKLNPVNAYLYDVFAEVFQPLIRRGWLQIIAGDAQMGAAAIAHDGVDEVHITGSQETHDRIVWGATAEERKRRKRENNPLLTKRITSELGNVSPWIIVPGKYTSRQLQFQAENVAASITNNAGFNCLSTRMLITERSWPQRVEFLDRLSRSLAETPRRVPYYPGAVERYERFADRPAMLDERGTLPWILIRDVSPWEMPDLYQTETFVGLCGEHVMESMSPESFLSEAVEFANASLFGTLCSAVTLPRGFARRHRAVVDRAIDELEYGSVCLNHWPGLVYTLMSAPWGGAPNADLAAVQSGIGTVHNTYLLDRVEKTLLKGPLSVFPKPAWFASNRHASAIAWNLFEFYRTLSPFRLSRLIGISLFG